MSAHKNIKKGIHFVRNYSLGLSGVEQIPIDIIESARKRFDYSPRTKRSTILNFLKTAIAASHNIVPSSNNNGQKREYNSWKGKRADEIMKLGKFPFAANIVRVAVGEKLYPEFIHKYVEARNLLKTHRQFHPPSEEEIKAFNEFNEGTISLDEFGQRTGFSNKPSIYFKLGRRKFNTK